MEMKEKEGGKKAKKVRTVVVNAKRVYTSVLSIQTLYPLCTTRLWYSVWYHNGATGTKLGTKVVTVTVEW